MKGTTLKIGLGVPILVCLSLFTTSSWAQTVDINPTDGWIRTASWNMLFPLANPQGCGGGGAGYMLGNWVAPHDIGLEDPKGLGDVWNDIDFGGAAQATGWPIGAALEPDFPDPTWVSIDWLNQQLPTPLPSEDVINYDGMAGGLGAQNDNVLGIATTYVENTTGSTLEVGVCSASDDSILVMINNCVTTNVSLCRGTAGGCAEVNVGYLPPGVSKITTLTFEGGGGWGFRLRLQKPDGTPYLDNDPDVVFHGTGYTPSDLFGQIQCLRRGISEALTPGSCPIETRTITLQAPPDGGDIVEELTPLGEVFTRADYGNGSMDLGWPASENFDITATPTPDSTDIETYPDSTYPVVDDLPNYRMIGMLKTNAGDPANERACLEQKGPAVSNWDSATKTGDITTSIGDQDFPWGGDDIPFQFNTVQGDFDIACRILSYSHENNTGRWGRHGLMARDLVNPDDARTDNDDPRTVRFYCVEGHGPADENQEDVAGGNRRHNPPNDEQEHFKQSQGNRGSLTSLPTYLRLIKRTDPDSGVVTFQGFVSELAGLGDGTLNPYNDGNWIPQYTDDWSNVANPETVEVGFYTFEHDSGWGGNPERCAQNTVQYQLLDPVVAPEPIRKLTMTWNNVAGDGVVSYTLNPVDTSNVNPGLYLSGGVGGVVPGLTSNGSVSFRDYRSAADGDDLGILEHAHDVYNFYDPVASGHTTYDAGTDSYTVFGSGWDIWGGEDRFQFGYKEVTGDFEAIVHVVDTDIIFPDHGWGRYGLMSRNGCQNNVRYAMIAETLPTESGARNNARHQYRQNTGDGVIWTETWDVFADRGSPWYQERPTWQRMVRQGNTIHTYMADDVDPVANTGTDHGPWQYLGADTDANRPATMLVGLAVQGRRLIGSQVVFDNLSIDPIEVEEPTCDNPMQILSQDYDLPDGSLPPGRWDMRNAGTFTPQVQGGRLRLTQQGIGNIANAVWYDMGNALNGAAFTVEFDAYMNRDGVRGQLDGTVTAAVSAAITGAGSGYTINDQLTLSGGVNSAAAVFNVDTVGGAGEVTGVSLVSGGSYTSVNGTGGTTGGTGTGCTLGVTWDVADPPNIDANPADGFNFAIIQGGSAELDHACVESADVAINDLTQVALVGTDVGGVSQDIPDTDPANPTGYASSSSTNGDIWTGGDSFMFRYDSINGDFDIAIELMGYTHDTGAGRWGKIGLMARQSLDPSAKYTHNQFHGPDLQDGARVARRRVDMVTNGNDETGLPRSPGAQPRFTRITRRGNIIQSWWSYAAGLGDGSLDPHNDCNWIAGLADDWSINYSGGAPIAVPADILVGFANSEHGGTAGGVQTVQYRILPPVPAPTASPIGFINLTGDAGGSEAYQGGDIQTKLYQGHPSWAVEFDNWVGGGRDDPAGWGAPDYDGRYSVGVNQNAQITSLIDSKNIGLNPTDLPNIFAPDGIHVTINVTPTGKVEVLAAPNTDLMAQVNVVSSQIIPLTGPVMLGFTGATGGAACDQEIDNLVVTASCCEYEPDTVSIDDCPTAPVDVGTDVTLTATVGGVDPGASAVYEWKIGEDVISTGATATVGAPYNQAPGDVTVTLSVGDGVCSEPDPVECTITFAIPSNWKPCDSSGDGKLDLTDVVQFLNYAFVGSFNPVCVGALDCDGDGGLTVTDAIQNLNFQFVNSIPPTHPDFFNCAKFSQNPADPNEEPACPVSEGCTP